MEQRDRRQRASRPEDFDSRAPHTLEPERIQSEFRPHRTSPNAEDDEAPAHHLDTVGADADVGICSNEGRALGSEGRPCGLGQVIAAALSAVKT